MRLDEHVNWRPLVSNSAKSVSTLRLDKAILNRTELFPAAHNNSAYLRLVVVQDGKEHLVILPFDDSKMAERFYDKLNGRSGETLKQLGEVQSD